MEGNFLEAADAPMHAASMIVHCHKRIMGMAKGPIRVDITSMELLLRAQQTGTYQQMLGPYGEREVPLYGDGSIQKIYFLP